ncbi:MAG TPA: ABC transporter substrate-binding protein [Mycobacteriales bacterium]|nr:ABC transporter substrate-binding protein [Mycobacteriales bacterium]
MLPESATPARTDPGRRRPRARRAVPLLAAALLATACGTTGGANGGSAAPTAPAGDPLDLTGVCPARVVFQSDWYPEMEYAAYYGLLGGRYTVDRARKRVVGDLVASGRDTGVDLEIREGGPALGFQSVTARMYQDRGITLGQATLDESIQNSAAQPTLQVVAPMEYIPVAIAWDRRKHPDWSVIADIGQTDTRVLYFQTDAYMQYLLGTGLLRASQVDGGFDGSPSRFVASRGTIAQQIFATQQPYVYKNELAGGQSFDLAWQLISDTGYPLYGQGVVVRAGDRERLAPCLRKLVPIIQRSAVDTLVKPDRVSALVVDIVRQYRDAWTYSPGLAAFTVKQMRDLGLVANGKDRTLGNFEDARVKRLIDISIPIYAAQKKPLKPGLQPADLVTNDFIDPAIGLPTR